MVAAEGNELLCRAKGDAPNAAKQMHDTDVDVGSTVHRTYEISVRSKRRRTRIH